MAGGGEAVCLSTCNRTELYLVDADPEAAEERASEALLGEEVELYRMTDEAAALHLFRVAAGLDSLVPGEGEILGQVRDAYEAGAHGPVLDRLFREALRVGQEGADGDGDQREPRVGLVRGCGAGPAGVRRPDGLPRAACRGRRGERARRPGARCARRDDRGRDEPDAGERGQAGRGVRLRTRFRSIGSAPELDQADVRRLLDELVRSRSCPGTRCPDRKGRPLFVIDLAVPRDVDPAVARLEDCYLYDIDDLQAVVRESLNGRWREAERAEAIVEREAERFRDWQASLQVVPAIASLRERAESIRSGELAKAESRLEGLSESERRTVESLTTQIVNKLLHVPIVRLKQAAATEGTGYVEVARDLFDLPDDENVDSRRKPR